MIVTLLSTDFTCFYQNLNSVIAKYVRKHARTEPLPPLHSDSEKILS